MKYKLIIFVVILATILIFGYSQRKKIDFAILATSYSEDSTSLYNYNNNNKLVDEYIYSIGGVEKLYFHKEGKGLIYDSYGEQLITINNEKTKEYKIKHDPIQLEQTKNGQVILHNDNLGFDVSIYNDDFKVMQQSEKLPGNAQNFIIKNDIVYVLSVLYDKNSKRTVGIYSLDINSLKVIELIEIPGLTFAFYLREMNGVLEIYGNKNEEAKDLTIYTHDISNKKTNLIVNTDIPVMWISKVIGEYKIFCVNN
ncbi:hypothetical protein [Lysinibacillus sp. ZYM-1]|uniref:hypothetical protein n=1 Tax=Lysinibacillus sp. ZYM-1 TaxID=1681184 RepID=UPI0006CEA143|nr:hypothetical protein [Lysinibacillus sp. ZYM-1]KPN96086.1 hypothetical protein AO843_18540 [Lysinibacillus sp. ZYM-1]